MNVFKHSAESKLCFLIPDIIQKYVADVVVVVDDVVVVVVADVAVVVVGVVGVAVVVVVSVVGGVSDVGGVDVAAKNR